MCEKQEAWILANPIEAFNQIAKRCTEARHELEEIEYALKGGHVRACRESDAIEFIDFETEAYNRNQAAIRRIAAFISPPKAETETEEAT